MVERRVGVSKCIGGAEEGELLAPHSEKELLWRFTVSDESEFRNSSRILSQGPNVELARHLRSVLKVNVSVEGRIVNVVMNMNAGLGTKRFDHRKQVKTDDHQGSWVCVSL
ncbi:MAG: hypothetical protein ACR2H4_04440 [Pyrinomonadaceae bacterium]